MPSSDCMYCCVVRVRFPLFMHALQELPAETSATSCTPNTRIPPSSIQTRPTASLHDSRHHLHNVDIQQRLPSWLCHSAHAHVLRLHGGARSTPPNREKERERERQHQNTTSTPPPPSTYRQTARESVRETDREGIASPPQFRPRAKVKKLKIASASAKTLGANTSTAGR